MPRTNLRRSRTAVSPERSRRGRAKAEPVRRSGVPAKADTSQGELYRFLAKYYDRIYGWKDYPGEARSLKTILRKYQRSRGRTLLDLACGTGKHLQHFAKPYRCTGLDLHGEMLKIAAAQVKGVTWVKGDMSRFRLARRFDVVTCLFSSIGYLKTYDRLARTVKNISRHLRPGGVALIEPWLTQRAYRVGRPGLTVYDGKDMKIVRITVARKRGMVSVMDMFYLVAEAHRGVRYFYDRHEMAMYDTRRVVALMERAGLQTVFLKPHQPFGRGLLVGVKPLVGARH